MGQNYKSSAFDGWQEPTAFLSPGYRIPSHFRRKILEGAHLPLKQLTPIESGIRCTPPSHRVVSVWNTNEVKEQTWTVTQLTRAYTEQIHGGGKEKENKEIETKKKNPKKPTLTPSNKDLSFNWNYYKNGWRSTVVSLWSWLKAGAQVNK